MVGDDVVAGARLWDRMTRRELIVFIVRTPELEGLLLAQYQSGTEAFFPPAVTVSADSLVHPGRGLLSVAASTGKFSFSCGAIQRFSPTDKGGLLHAVPFCLCFVLPWVSISVWGGVCLALFPFNAIFIFF